MVHLQIAHGVHHDLFDERLHPIVVVQRGRQDVGADVLVHGGILVQELLNGLPVDQHHTGRPGITDLIRGDGIGTQFMRVSALIAHCPHVAD